MPTKQIHTKGYFLDDSNEGHFFDQGLSEEFCREFKGCDVVDLGCGRGDYVSHMVSSSINAVGFDGNPSQFPNVIPSVDLTVPIDLLLTKMPDWIISLEVGEHIPSDLAHAFLDNVRHASVGIVLSWAVPGQGGYGHVNERPNEWVIEELRRRGWCHQSWASKYLRIVVQIPWFKNTLMVFQK